MACESERLLVQQIRQGDARAWEHLISRYEGRLRAFVNRRLHDHAASEDVVQETFLGFLNSLPNFDDRRELQTYLFTIASHKLTDYLRKSGRHPLQLVSDGPGDVLHLKLDDHDGASTIARDQEQRQLESEAIARGLGQLIEHWRAHGELGRIKVLELLFVKGWANRDVAAFLEVSEQHVANVRFAAVKKVTENVRGSALPAEVFPELQPDAGGRRMTPITREVLASYLDDALSAAQTSEVERQLRQSDALRQQLRLLLQDRDRGEHSVGAIWRRHRLSCPDRERLGSFLLGVLADDEQDYVEFHLKTIGCAFCQANLTDLQDQQKEAAPQAQQRRRRYFQSSAGLLNAAAAKKPGAK